MLNKIKNRKESGFTIIEVLIVLAIAGLIMVVVFLAVPNLQRSQRNNGRQSEASRLSAAIGNFVSNNQGNLPTTANDVTSIVTDFGTFKYFSGVSPTAVAGNSLVAGSIVFKSGVNTAATVTGDALMVDVKAKCGTPSSNPGMKTTAGTSRQVALIYTTESSGGNYNQVCTQAE